MLRECFSVRVTARWCLAESPVYLRGRILPVSVTYRLIACGCVKGISAGVGVCCFCSVVVLMARKEVRTWRTAPGCQPVIEGLLPAPSRNNSIAREGRRINANGNGPFRVLLSATTASYPQDLAPDASKRAHIVATGHSTHHVMRTAGHWKGKSQWA